MLIYAGSFRPPYFEKLELIALKRTILKLADTLVEAFETVRYFWTADNVYAAVRCENFFIGVVASAFWVYLLWQTYAYERAVFAAIGTSTAYTPWWSTAGMVVGAIALTGIFVWRLRDIQRRRLEAVMVRRELDNDNIF